MRTSARAIIAALVALLTVVTMAWVAEADQHKPIPTKSQVQAAKDAVTRRAGDVAAIRARLVLAQSRLQRAATKAEIAAEAFNGARWHLQLATAKANAAEKAATAATAKVAAQRAGIAELATQSFEQGSQLTGITAYLGSGGPTEVADQITVTQSVDATLQHQFEQYAAADTLAQTARRAADQAKRDQQALTAKAAAARDQAAAAANAAQDAARTIAAQRRTLIDELAKAQRISVALATQRQNGLEAIARAKAAAAAAAKARAEAAAAAAAAKHHQSSGGDSSQSGPPSGGVATTAAAARAIAFAKQQLGEPYVWGAAGPGSWDCSGLTMMSWRQGGVSLPHYAAAQYADIEHISVNDLRPGDLVFWGDSPGSIHHVAMYLGNGMIIQAPHTGASVDIVPMYFWTPPNFFGRP